VLNQFRLSTNPSLDAVNDKHGISQAHDRPLDTDNGGYVTNTQLFIAGLHSAWISNTSSIYGVNLQQDPANAPGIVGDWENCAVVSITERDGVTVAGQDALQIVPGSKYRFITTQQCNPDRMPETAAPNRGLVVWVEVSGKQQKIGQFDLPATAAMKYWPACGGDGKLGIVHGGKLPDGAQGALAVQKMQWTAPTNLAIGSSVSFVGSISQDTGFGLFNTTFTVVAPS